MKSLNIKYFFLLVPIFSQLVMNLNSSAGEEKKYISNSNIIWEKIYRKKIKNNNPIIWEQYQGPLEFELQRKYSDDSFLENKKSVYEKLIEIEPYLPFNTFLDSGEIISNVQWKSAFSGGAGGGTGHQNISSRIDYGLNSDTLLSIYLSETDDPLYNLINGELIPNNWASIALGYKKKLFEFKKRKESLSFASSIEYWIVSSGSDEPNNKKSIFNQVNNDTGLDKHKELIYSLSFPYKKTFSKRSSIVFVPGMTFLPKILGERNIGDNFYGNNVFFGSGLEFKFSDNIGLNASYTYLLGPGNNYFDNNLNFGRKPIYSFGLNWDFNPIFGIKGKITNGYGSTPATGLLTIPSDNKPLYYLSGTYRPYKRDTVLKPLEEEDESLLMGGITVSNGLIPIRGKSQVGLNFDSFGNIFGSYKYSLSNLFQLEIINLGSYEEINYNSNKNKEIRDTYLDQQNLNYRIGGKLMLLSPQKNDPFWLSSRISLGRNDSTKQGYLFSELISTFKFDNWLKFNINPKYLFSGVDNISALGVSFNVNLLKSLSVISEANIGLSDNSESNNTFAFRYSYSPNKSLDLYATNSVGLADIGQMLKSDEYKFGIKLNFIF